MKLLRNETRKMRAEILLRHRRDGVAIGAVSIIPSAAKSFVKRDERHVDFRAALREGGFSREDVAQGAVDVKIIRRTLAILLPRRGKRLAGFPQRLGHGGVTGFKLLIGGKSIINLVPGRQHGLPVLQRCLFLRGFRQAQIAGETSSLKNGQYQGGPGCELPRRHGKELLRAECLGADLSIQDNIGVK